MPRMASNTGLIAARIRPIRRPKPKKLELQGSSMPAPFILRPFAGLYNPYPYGCSVLCNHPADGEAKEIVRRAKDTWTTEGKALLLPSEIRVGKSCEQDVLDTATVPEELFRRYTETDSRSPSPEPPSLIHQEAQSQKDEKNRASLVLDLRANSHDVQESETLSWHALTLEPISSLRRNDLSGSSMSSRRKPPMSSRHLVPTTTFSSPVRSIPALKVSDAASRSSVPTSLARGIGVDDDEDEDEDEDENSSPEEPPIRRRGKLRRKKRKCRRGSIYGQQTEVREPPEPLETQVSQICEGSRRGSTCLNLEENNETPMDKVILPVMKQNISSSFLPPDVFNQLSRNLDQEMVEWEFNSNRRFALEEVLRLMGDFHPTIKGPRQNAFQAINEDVPRLFYRQSARFELLDSQSLFGLTPLDYLSRYVYVNDTRKMMFGRTFNKYREESTSGPRYLLRKYVFEALHDVMGRDLALREIAFLEQSLGEMHERLDFRTWCGICAFTERSLPELLPREEDPPSWIEKADFEMLDRRLDRVRIHAGLASMLRLIRDR